LPTLEELMQLGVNAIQYGCLTMTIGPGNKVIEKWLSEIYESNLITLSHDLNIRPALGFERAVERARVENLNQISHIIKASDADIEWLYDLPAGSNLDQIASEWSAGKLVIITRGDDGASLYTDGKRTDVPGFSIQLSDTVGAGDTFIATFLAELNAGGALGENSVEKIGKLEIEKLVEFARAANAAAAIVCERTGCQPPTKAEILAKVGQ